MQQTELYNGSKLNQCAAARVAFTVSLKGNVIVPAGNNVKYNFIKYSVG